MASGSFELTKSGTTSSGSYIIGKIEWSSVANMATNTSRLTVSLWVKKANPGMTLTEYTDGTWGYNIGTVGPNNSYGGTTSKKVLESWVKLESWAWDIPHDSDGSKSITISGQVRGPSGTSFSGLKTTGSKTVTLDTIKRETTIDSLKRSSNYIDGVITALYTPQYAEFYNRRIISVIANGTPVYTHTKNLGKQNTSQQTHTMQFDSNELSKIYANTKNTATPLVRVTFQTYSDSGYTTKVGTDKSREITLSLPESVKPTASLEVTMVNSNAWVKGKNIYVAGLSGATVKLSSAPGTGADPASTSITYDGVTYNTTELNITTLKKSGNFEFTAKATDSRGRSTTVTKSIAVLPYSAPAVVVMQSERGTYDNGWVAKDEGNDVKLTFKANLALAAYDNTYSATFKVDGSDKPSNHGATTGLDSNTDCAVYFLGINGETSHTIAMTITDNVGVNGGATLTVPTIHITIEFRENGKGVAFGKTSEKDETFECAWDAKFDGDVTIDGSLSVGGILIDTIVAQGTSAINHTVEGVTGRSGTWTYRKWSSGIMECWGIGNVDVKVNMEWSGTGLYYGVVSTINYPFPFVELPVCTVDVAYGTNEKSLVVASCGRGTVNYARPIMLCRNTSETVNCDLHYYAIGRWK